MFRPCKYSGIRVHIKQHKVIYAAKNSIDGIHEVRSLQKKHSDAFRTGWGLGNLQQMQSGIDWSKTCHIFIIFLTVWQKCCIIMKRETIKIYLSKKIIIYFSKTAHQLNLKKWPRMWIIFQEKCVRQAEEVNQLISGMLQFSPQTHMEKTLDEEHQLS